MESVKEIVHSFLLSFGEETNRSQIRDLSIIEAVVPLLGNQALSLICSITNSDGHQEERVNLIDTTAEIILTVITSIKEKSNLSEEYTQSSKVQSLEQTGNRQVSTEKTTLELTEMSCLYLEDQRDSQILLKTQMKDLKDIKFVGSLEEALPLLSSEKFDFILMDINLQGEYSGMDALKIIRKNPKYANLPIIATTAYVLPGDREKFIAAGFDSFVTKPVFREKIILALDTVFSKKKIDKC